MSEDSEIPNSILYVVGVRYKFIWKKATEPFSKMPEAKKNKHSHWKKQFCFKKSLQIHMKKGTEPPSKMPEAKKTSTFIEKQFCFKKACKFIWKKGTEPSSKMPEAKKTNTLIEKTMLFQKSW